MIVIFIPRAPLWIPAMMVSGPLWLKRGSPILFLWSQWAVLLCVKREWRFVFFFLWLVNLCFSILGKLVFDFFVICEICTFRTNFSLFWRFQPRFKLINYTELDVKSAHSTYWNVLLMEDWELTTVTVNQESEESSLSQCYSLMGQVRTEKTKPDHSVQRPAHQPSGHCFEHSADFSIKVHPPQVAQPLITRKWVW